MGEIWTVPSIYKGFTKFAPGKNPTDKVDLCKGYADISIFLKKEEKDISSQISLEFAFTYRKANTFTKILKLYGKWQHINPF